MFLDYFCYLCTRSVPAAPPNDLPRHPHSAAEAYRIPERGSMEPTLQVGDWLFVNNLRLGPHIPFTQASLPGYAEPRRNDVVVFVSPPQDLAIRISRLR